MEYVIPIVIVVLLDRRLRRVHGPQRHAARAAPAAKGEDAPGIGEDDTPLGDTTEHAGEQTEEGTTVGKADAERERRHRPAGALGRAGDQRRRPDPTDPDAAAHVVRPGEAEGAERLDFTGEQPEARARDAQLADRDAEPRAEIERAFERLARAAQGAVPARAPRCHASATDALHVTRTRATPSSS